MTISTTQSLWLSTETVQLHFERADDRWAHQWFVGEDQRAWLRDVEGTPDEPWPPSPPLHDVNQMDPEAGGSILAVGMAGRSHWSASYSPDPNSEQSIIADLACPHKQSSPSKSGLGSV